MFDFRCLRPRSYSARASFETVCAKTSPPLAIGCVAVPNAGVLYTLCATPVTFSEARDRCQATGADLIHIDDADENDWLSSQVTGWVWIGASDSGSEGDWRWVADDSAVDDGYDAWDVTEPLSTGDCAQLENGSWSAHSCTLTGGYVCE